MIEILLNQWQRFNLPINCIDTAFPKNFVHITLSFSLSSLDCMDVRFFSYCMASTVDRIDGITFQLEVKIRFQWTLRLHHHRNDTHCFTGTPIILLLAISSPCPSHAWRTMKYLLRSTSQDVIAPSRPLSAKWSMGKILLQGLIPAGLYSLEALASYLRARNYNGFNCGGWLVKVCFSFCSEI